VSWRWRARPRGYCQQRATRVAGCTFSAARATLPRTMKEELTPRSITIFGNLRKTLELLQARPEPLQGVFQTIEPEKLMNLAQNARRKQRI
jgi:hypothetical protein